MLELFRISLRATGEREVTLDDFIGQCRTPCPWCAAGCRRSDRGLLEDNVCGAPYELDGKRIECSWRPGHGGEWARIDTSNPRRIILSNIEIGAFGEHEDPWRRFEEEVDQSWDRPSKWLDFQPESIFDELREGGLTVEVFIEVRGTSIDGTPENPLDCSPEFLAACTRRGLDIRFRQVQTTNDFLD